MIEPLFGGDAHLTLTWHPFSSVIYTGGMLDGAEGISTTSGLEY